MALSGALVSHDKWRLCILNGFGALAMLTRSPTAGWNFSPDLSSLGSVLTEESNQFEILTQFIERMKTFVILGVCVCVHVSLS